MNYEQKLWVLNATKEVVVAELTNSTVSPTKEGGENVAEFIDEIYNKFTEIIKRNDVETSVDLDISAPIFP